VRFLLVDEILEMTPGQRIRAVKTLSADEELFQDHFPGFPVVPGVLLTEMMAQAAGKCLFAEDPNRGRPMLAQIKAASFRSWVRPGEMVTLLGEIRSSRAQFATASCQAEVNGHPVCSAELMFSFQSASAFAAGYRDEVLERFLGRPVGDSTANAKDA
jgi:3-hydroxyacyl-[acyl-carrier-protein] dehydratase